MARKELMNQGDVFILNDTIVGKGADNGRRSDVQLVQFFLKQFFIVRPDLFAKLPKPRKNASNVITIDGRFGPQTGQGIFEFQQFVLSRGNSIKVDGLVNVATAAKSSITNTFYTILHLNNFFKTFVDQTELLGSLENHPDILQHAPELQAELSRAVVGDKINA